MKDILGKGTGTPSEADEARGHVGSRYTSTEPASMEVIREHAKRIRAEEQTTPTTEGNSQSPSEDKLTRLGEALRGASSTRPGWWF